MATLGLPSATTTTTGAGGITPPVMAAGTSTPASPRAPASPPSRPSVVSPAQRAYLRSQSLRIISNGGSEADVVEFLKMEGHKPPPIVMTGGPAQRDVGTIEGLSMSAVQGLTFGFGDEVIGSLLGVLTGEGARGGIDAYRADLKQWEDAHGGAALTAEIAGGIATGGVGLARAGVMKGARAAGTLGSRVARSIGVGAAGGAAQGAGDAQGGISDRSKAAIFGAAAGAVFTGALAGLGRVVGAVARPLVRGASSGALPASIAETVQHGIPGLGTAEDHAREVIWRALVADGISSPAAVRGRIAALQASGAPVTLADIGGDATLKLAAEASSLRTPAQRQMVETIIGRQAEQGDRLVTRMIGSLFRSHKLGTRNAYEAVEALATEQKRRASPLYEAAFQRTVPITDELQTLLKRPVFREAYELGRMAADEEDLARAMGAAEDVGGITGGLKVPPLATDDAAAAMRTKLQEMGVPEDRIREALARAGGDVPTELPLRGLDYMQRGLSLLIERGFKGSSMNQQTAKALRAQLNTVLRQFEETVPEYGSGRALWRGFESAKEAVEAGREAFAKNAHPHLVAKTLGELSPTDQDFYRLGATQALSDAIYSGRSETRDIAKDFFGGRLHGGKSLQADRIRALFGDDAVANDFMRRVSAEARISETAREGVGAARGNAVREFEEAAEGTLPNVRMTPELTIAGIVVDGLRRGKRTFMRDVSDEISLLFTKGIDDPMELEVLAEAMEEVHRRASGSNVLKRGVMAATGAGAARMALPN